jgi:hypothetical protein
MSYNTSYSLELTNLSEAQTAKVSIDDLIEEAKNGKIEQSTLIQKLEELKVGVVDVTEAYIFSKLRSECKDAKYFLSEKGGSSGCDGSWRDYENEVKKFSKQFPTWLFTIHGEGEEAMDLWVSYILNGKMQHEKAQITFASFNQNCLV